MKALVQVPPTSGAIAAYAPASERAREYARAARSQSTLRAYKVDWADFTHWCTGQQVGALPADPETIATYIASQAESHKPSSIQRRLSSISQVHQVNGYESPCKTELVRSVMKGIRRELGTAPTEKSPLVAADIRAMVEALPGTLIGTRDKALISLCFAAALRRSELVALDVEDIEFTPDGLIVNIRRSKTDQEGRGYKIGIPVLPASPACPVRLLRAWLEASRIDSGPIFRPVALGGRMASGRLSPRAVALVVKRRLPKDRDAAKYAGHSLRAGFVTSAVAGGAGLKAIMRISRHRSLSMLLRYDREASLFRGNAVAKTGL